MKKILILLLTLSISLALFGLRNPENPVSIDEFSRSQNVIQSRSEVINYNDHISAALDYLLRMYSDVNEDLAGNGYSPYDYDRDDAGWNWTLPAGQQQHTDENSFDNLRVQGSYGAFRAYEDTGEERWFLLLEDICDYIRAYSEYTDDHVTITYDGDTITNVEIQKGYWEPHQESDIYTVGSPYDAGMLLQFQNLDVVTPDIYKNAAREMIINYHLYNMYNTGITNYPDIGARIYAGRGTDHGLIPWDMESVIDAISLMHDSFPNDPIFNDTNFDPDDNWDNWNDYLVTCVNYLYTDPGDKFPAPGDMIDLELNGHPYAEQLRVSMGLGSLIYCYAKTGIEPYISAKDAYIDWILEYMLFDNWSIAGAYRYNLTNYYNSWSSQQLAFMVKALGISDPLEYSQYIRMGSYVLAASQDLDNGGWYNSDNTHYPSVAGERVYGLTYASGINEVYVDGINGSDDNPGTEELPYATIQKGIKRAAGGIVHVETGIYDESLEFYQTCKVIGENGSVVIKPSILSTYVVINEVNYYAPMIINDAPTVAQGVILDNIDIDLSLLTSTDYDNLTGIVLYETDGVFRNLNIYGTTQDGNASYGIYAFGAEDYPEFNLTNVTISDFSTDGIFLGGTTLTAEINSNTITGIASGDYGVYATAIDGLVLLNNVIDNCAIGVYVENTADAEITGNTVTNTLGRATGTGVSIDGADVVNTEIYFNTLTDLNIAINIGSAVGTGNAAHYNDLSGSDTHIANGSSNSFNGDWNYYGDGESPVVTGTVTTDNQLENTPDYISAPVISNSNGEITLTWNEIQGATSYTVYTATTANGTYTALEPGITEHSYSHTPIADQLFYKVSTATGAQGPASGYVNYFHTYNSNTTNQLFLAYGFDMSYVMASEFIENEIDTDNCSVISRWSSGAQAWISATYLPGLGWDGDFELEVGGAYMLGFETDADVFIYGRVTGNPVYNFVATATTNINSAMVPLDATETTASGIGVGIPNCQIISHWLQDQQGWQTATYISSIGIWVNNYEISVGMPLMIGVSANGTWAP
jgi:parallel beta-helix repeat protein